MLMPQGTAAFLPLLCWGAEHFASESELGPEHKLDAARRARAHGAGVDDARDASEAAAYRGGVAGGRPDAAGRSLLNGVIEQVVGGGAEIQGEPFRHLEALLQRRIDLVHARPVADVAPQVTPGPTRRGREGRGVEPPIDALVDGIN